MWVAVDIQMKRRQFGLVKAIMPTSVCAIMSRRVRARTCGQERSDYLRAWACTCARTGRVCCRFNTLRL